MTYLQIFGTLISGGTLGALLTYFIKLKRQKNDDFTKVIESYKDYNHILLERLTNLENEVKLLRTKESKLSNEITKLRNQLLLFEGSKLELPLPLWIKDTKGTMIYLNESFESTFLTPLNFEINDYIGKKDNVIFGNKQAKKFGENDKKVIAKKDAIRFFETIEINDTIYYLEVLKFPRIIQNAIIGVGGIVLKMSDKKKNIIIDDND